MLTYIKSIKYDIAKWSDGHNAIIVQPARSEEIPYIIRDPRSVFFAIDSRFTVAYRTANTQQNLLPGILTAFDLIRKAIADAVDQASRSLVRLGRGCSPAMRSHIEGWVAGGAGGELIDKG